MTPNQDVYLSLANVLEHVKRQRGKTVSVPVLGPSGPFGIVFDVAGVQLPTEPAFRGQVLDNGGGVVTILVDRDTMDYPPIGWRIAVSLEQM